jgi:uncharacterized phosphosugar-binding protein
MKKDKRLSGIDLYFNRILALEKKVIDSQRNEIEKIANQMARTIATDGRIFLFGTGHSHMMMEEGFFRAGGLAAVVPIFYSALMVHEFPGLSSFLERTPGIARRLLESFDPRQNEMIFIYSNSGVNTMPIEMALVAGEKDLKVVAVCSLEYAKSAPLSLSGKRLFEVADFSLDNGGVPGDALIPVEGTTWKVAPSSTLINVLLWNCLLTETIYLLKEMNVDLPLFASLNMPGAAQHNEAILEKWTKINPYLK